MKSSSFKLSAVAISILVGFSGAASAATLPAVTDVAGLGKNSAGYYTGGGAVFIGGHDASIIKDGVTGGNWESINTDTSGFWALVNSSGYKAYLDAQAETLSADEHYFIDESYARFVHGQRLANTVGEGSLSTPANIVTGLKMGALDNRYVKTQKVSFYVRDASGNIQYQKDAEGKDRVDEKGNRIPLTVSKNVVLDQNADVYIKPAHTLGGAFGLQNSAIYSQVKSVKGDVAAVSMSGDLRETNNAKRARDVFVVKNTVIDNTINADALANGASGHPKDEEHKYQGEEHQYKARPWATGLSINATSKDYLTNSEDNTLATHRVAKNPNVIVDNAVITAKNLAAVRRDNHDAQKGEQYDALADKKSTAVSITGSGLFVAINKSTLTGGMNNAGKSLKLGGHANRVDVSNSVMNGGVVITHDGHEPVIKVSVNRDKNGDYIATGASITDHGLVSRERNGTTLNLTNNSVVNGDITASGVTGYQIQLVDTTNPESHAILDPETVSGSLTAKTIYDNAIASVANTLLTNANGAYTPVTVNVDHSTVNGAVKGITTVNRPDEYERVLSWNPDLNLKKGAVWNAAATANGASGVRSDVHDLNLSHSTLNLVNLETNRPTLGDQGRYEDLGSARVVVHNTLTQDKDEKGRYQASHITVGKAVVEPLLDMGGRYALGSLQVKGAVKGDYQLHIANSGVEPYVKDGYLASTGAGATNPHSFVNYLDKNSDARFTGRTELGVYQYDVVNTLNDKVHGERNVYFKNNGQLSNTASLAQSLQASDVSIANMETEALQQRLTASRHVQDNGGVWAAWYGGTERNHTVSGAGYRVQNNGLIVGTDTKVDAQNGGNWLAGLAFTTGKAKVNSMNSSADVNNYGMQFYVSRRWDNGVFVDTQAQFSHNSKDAHVQMLDGQRAQGTASNNGFGAGMKLGYTWQREGFFAEPYAKAAARTFDGAAYTLSNGMVVQGGDYKSMIAELGVDVGYTFDFSSQRFVRPYLHMAGLNEFASNNTMRLNNVIVDDSIDGAAMQIGMGTEVGLMNNLGGYAGFNYTGGSNIERPWQANVGVNYTW
ncbi:hypothetical protein CIG19_09790 [Enterobacterales bacterium CwR94]|nr:hypothetical protein CIG19_09790 [Enterobacterales bacterium CwR94]